MILEKQPIDMTELKELLEGVEDSEKKKAMETYLKKFSKIKPEKAKSFKEDLKKLELLKLKDEHFAKIIDLLPEDASDLNKIFVDVSLNEDEINKILEVVAKHR